MNRLTYLLSLAAVTLLIISKAAAENGDGNPMFTLTNDSPVCWRYRIVVTLATPEGDRSGSSVRQQCYYRAYATKKDQDKPDHLRKRIFLEYRRGQALKIDLGSRGIVFSPMKGGNGSAWAEEVVALSFPYSTSDFSEKLKYYSQLKNEKKDLSPPFYPTLVHFADITNPRSMKYIYQAKSGSLADRLAAKEPLIDKLEEVLGKGVKYKNASIEMTDEDVVLDLDKTLTWVISSEEFIGEAEIKYFYRDGTAGESFGAPLASSREGAK